MSQSAYGQIDDGDILVVDISVNSKPFSPFQGALFNVDPINGQRDVISNFTDGTQGQLLQRPNTVLITNSDNLLVLDANAGIIGGLGAGAIFSIDPATGKRTVFSIRKYKLNRLCTWCESRNFNIEMAYQIVEPDKVRGTGIILLKKKKRMK